MIIQQSPENLLQENKEIFKKIKGFEDLYLISNYGRVMSLGYEYVNSKNILRKVKSKYKKPTDKGFIFLNDKAHNRVCYSVPFLVYTHFIEERFPFKAYGNYRNIKLKSINNDFKYHQDNIYWEDTKRVKLKNILNLVNECRK